MRTIFLVLLLTTLVMFCCDNSINVPIIEAAYWKELGCVCFSGLDYFKNIAINSNGDIFVSGCSTIYATYNGGKTWRFIFSVSPSYLCCPIENVFISSNNYLYTRCYRSIDNGDNWEIMDATSCVFPECGIASMAENSKGQLFAITAGGVYTSTDYGESWDLVVDMGGACIAINMKDHIFICGGNYIRRSTDNGETWEMLKDDFDYPINRIVINHNEDVFVKGCQGNIYRSADNGETWEDISSHVDGCGDIAINSLGHIYVAMGTDFLLCSMDNGKSWIKLGKALYGIEEIAITSNDRIITIFDGCAYQSIYPLE